MPQSSRQIVLLLLFLAPVPALALSFSKPVEMLADDAMVKQALASLVSGPLRGQDVLIVSDDHSEKLVDVGAVVSAAGSSQTSVYLATQHSILHTTRPTHHTKGALLTALLLFHHDPTGFLLHLADNDNWNPSYLILFCLDPNLNTTSVINKPVVQRSQFILLLQPENRFDGQRLIAYTSLPKRVKAPIGPWTPDKFLTRQSIFISRFRDFAGDDMEIPVACYDEPFFYLKPDGECVGANFDALQAIGDKLNFKSKIILIDDVTWGTKVNGTWDGMLGEMMYGHRDIVVSSFRLNPDRFNDFDFVYPYWRYSFAAIILRPPPMPRWRNILYPFTTETWGLIIATTIIVASSLSFLVHRLHNVRDPSSLALKVVSGLFGQAMDDKKVRDFPWARVWLIFWWLSVDILAAAYMSNLMSVLTVPAYPKRLKTLQQLANSHILPAMLDYGGFVPQALKTSKNPVYAKLGDRMYLAPVIMPNLHDLTMGLVLNGTHALFDSIDYVIFLQYSYGAIRSTYIMEEKLYKDYMTWLLPRNTPYTPIISERLQRIVETGILGKIYQMHIATADESSTIIRGDGVLTLDHLQGAFIAWGLGLVLAALVLGGERLYPVHYT